MATAVSSSSNPSTPPYPQFPRLPHASSAAPSIQRNASTSSSHSTTTTSSTSSLAAAPMRPPPSETRTAATSPSQMGNDGTMPAHGDAKFSGGRGAIRNGPRSDMARHGTLPIPPHSPVPAPTSPLSLQSSPLHGKSTTAPLPYSPTTPRAPDAPWSTRRDVSLENPPRVTITTSGPSSSPPSSPRGRGLEFAPASPVQNKLRTLSVSGKSERDLERERRMSQASNGSSSGNRKPSAKDWVFGEEIGRGSYSTVSLQGDIRTSADK
jgi:3-phosphoinositide dependent protein kinase-1